VALFNSVCNDLYELVPDDIRVSDYHVDYAHNLNLCTFNSLEYFIIYGALSDISLLSVDVFHDGDNLSGNDAILYVFHLNNDSIRCSGTICKSMIAWHEAD